MKNNKVSIFAVAIAGIFGAGITWAVLSFMSDDGAQREHIADLEGRILDLELALTQKEVALAKAREWSLNIATPETTNSQNPAAMKLHSSTAATALVATPERESPATLDNQQVLKDLGTTTDRDPRSFSEKVTDLLTANPNRENVALVSQAIMDMAENSESLPDYALQSLYQNQTDPDVKRVAAQVLSARGDNSLIDKQISEARAGLRSTSPAERQKTLAELAKTRYAGAATAIAPLLQDNDTGVKLDALLALRATGNQNHLYLVEGLRSHPDPAVSWLANDVANTLQNLSDKARTRLTNQDIAAELPAIATP